MTYSDEGNSWPQHARSLCPLFAPYHPPPVPHPCPQSPPPLPSCSASSSTCSSALHSPHSCCCSCYSVVGFAAQLKSWKVAQLKSFAATHVCLFCINFLLPSCESWESWPVVVREDIFQLWGKMYFGQTHLIGYFLIEHGFVVESHRYWKYIYLGSSVYATHCWYSFGKNTWLYCPLWQGGYAVERQTMGNC